MSIYEYVATYMNNGFTRKIIYQEDLTFHLEGHKRTNAATGLAEEMTILASGRYDAQRNQKNILASRSYAGSGVEKESPKRSQQHPVESELCRHGRRERAPAGGRPTTPGMTSCRDALAVFSYGAGARRTLGARGDPDHHFEEL